MRRVALFFRRLGVFQGLLYVLFIAYMLWAYSRLWVLPGGPFFVLSVLALGIGIATALMPLMYRHYLTAHKIVSLSGWVVMLALVIIFRGLIPLPPIGYWLMHIVLWLQVTSNFWIGTYEPRLVWPDAIDLRQLRHQHQSEFADENGEVDTGESDEPSGSISAIPPADDHDNWYRRG